MKIRQGFVSNSSSSSFVVIGNKQWVIPNLEHQTLHVPETFGGETEFGWTPEDHRDIGSRINFAYLQCLEAKDCPMSSVKERSAGFLEMLEEVLKKHTKCMDIKWELKDKPDESMYAYIDHQSSAIEGQNLEIFDSEEQLAKFIFAPDSLVHTDNDNH